MSGPPHPSLPEIQTEQSPTTVVAIVLIALLVTTLVTLGVFRAERQHEQSALSERLEQAAGTLSSDYAKYETLLYAARALFAGSDYVSGNDWALFTEDVMSGQHLAGLVGLSWIPYLEGRSGIELLSMDTVRDGRHPVTITPPGDRPIYCPIIYSEPYRVNAPSIGRDVCTVETVRDALRLSREQPKVFLSEPLRLVGPDNRAEPGLVLLIWVEDVAPDHTGWIGVSVRSDEVFGPSRPASLQGRFAVDDISNGAALAESIFESRGPMSESGFLTPTLTVERALEAGGRVLRISISERSGHVLAAGLILLFGLLASGLLTSYLLSVIRTRQRAEALAEQTSGKLEASERLLASITDNIFEGIYRGKPGAGLVYANEPLARMFGYGSTEDLLSASDPIRFARPEQRDELLERLEQDGFYRDIEVEFIRQDGTRFICVNNAVAHFDADWNVEHFDGAIYDITARKQAEQEVHHLAHYDVLTGLPNRAMLDRRLRQSIQQARAAGQSMAVLFMDLDHFKTINDSLGHSLGDQLLVQVAKRLGMDLRADDSVSRLGGDEFLMLLPGVDADDAARSAQRILDLFMEPFDLEGHELRISPSIGIAMYPDDARGAETLIRNADAAMYAAKENGRSNYQFFTREMNERAHERLRLESDLRQAIRNHQFTLHYQPIVRIEDGRMVGAEALLRWQHPERGPVPPDRFIPIAEQSGLIVEIGNWVIERVCRQLADWMASGLPAPPIAVNVSALQFWRGGLVDQVRKSLDSNSLDAEWLELELTESVIMRDADTASHVIAQLNDLGVRLSIDDFGTGYSSLSYLKKFSISKLKIDQSFVQDLGQDPDDAAIVSAVVSMAEDLSLDVVAEGVETEDQRRLLQARGCSFAQGFLFDPPMDSTAFEALLRSSAAPRPND